MTSAKPVLRRLSTGVSGLDEILGGGLPEFSFNLIAGPPGSGKTTLAHQMMFALATPERPALYFTVLGEPPLKMLRYQQQFAFFDQGRIGSSVHFVNLGEEAAAGDRHKILARISDEVMKHGPGFVFVDSFRAVMLATLEVGGASTGLLEFTQSLAMLMTSWQATTFLIGEYTTQADPNPVFTVADGLIWMSQSVQRNSVVRKLDVMKMRGQATLPGLHTFRIDLRGVHVFAPAQPQAAGAIGRTQDVDQRISLGIPVLDAMMGGGVPRGYSLLVAGPSGSGKSILAAAFLLEGARQGETSVLAAFEQRPTRSRGPQLADLIAKGRVGVISTQDTELSVDEIAMQLLAEVGRLKATRVVIDSLSGFELALAPTFRDDFRESLARLVSALAGAGVTTLMTSELEDRYTDLRFSPYGTAFLTDVIVVQRYVEMECRLQRILAVVKVRASAHSHEFRLYHIDDDGIHVDDMPIGYTGLLGGRPNQQLVLATGDRVVPRDDVQVNGFA
ncbi:MAG: ATPase domain-containing protein [Burkholderiaceae bacterium]